MAGFSVPAAPFSRRPAFASSTSQMLSRTPCTSTPTQARTAAATTAAAKKRPRNIACVTCNKQKKKCGLERPCTRCVDLKITCTQPVKPSGYCYFSKKRKLDDDTPAFPGSLWTAMERPRSGENQPQHLPSPSPTVSTVGTPQTSFTSISSYDDSASNDVPGGKSGDVPGPGPSDSHKRPRSVSLDRASILTSAEEPPSKIPPMRNMSQWDLPVPPEELPDEIVKNSKFADAPIFGVERPIHESYNDFVTSGEPMDLGEDYTGGVDGWVSLGGLDGLEGLEGLEGQGVDEILGIDAGVAVSNVASGAGGGIIWNLDWLDDVDLLNTGTVLDDVDLLDFDFSSLDNDISTDQLSQILAQVLPQQPPAPSPPPQPSLEAEAELDIDS